MATTTPKIFGQLKPSNVVSPNLLYIAPAGKQAQITIFISNQGSGQDFFRVALVPNGQSITTARYVAYDTPLIGFGVFAVSGIGLDTGDSIFVKSSSGNLSFTATGIEFGP
jgi:hypothetical protein